MLKAQSSKLQALSSKLLADLPFLLPDDPAMAAVIAESMAGDFGEVKVKGEGEELANKAERSRDGS